MKSNIHIEYIHTYIYIYIYIERERETGGIIREHPPFKETKEHILSHKKCGHHTLKKSLMILLTSFADVTNH